MREAQFLKQNAEKWKLYETELHNGGQPDLIADRFIELTDDLSYSKTFYPKSKTTQYLNGLASGFHQKIYKNKKEKSRRIIDFWQFELPVLFYIYRRQFAWSFLFFLCFCFMGALSAHYDDTFIRLILGDSYVNMTNDNIAKGNPFGVYQSMDSATMFVFIAFNNIKVAIVTFVAGIFLSVGTVFALFNNGLMLGSFEYYFFQKGLGFKSITVVFLHGTLEIWAIIIAGAAGLILGNSFLFPATFGRTVSLLIGAKNGLKILVGLVPVFLVAAFIEGYITRYANMPLPVSLSILTASVVFIIWYFVLYPLKLNRKIQTAVSGNSKATQQKNFQQWINKKSSLEKSGILATISM